MNLSCGGQTPITSNEIYINPSKSLKEQILEQIAENEDYSKEIEEKFTIEGISEAYSSPLT